MRSENDRAEKRATALWRQRTTAHNDKTFSDKDKISSPDGHSPGWSSPIAVHKIVVQDKISMHPSTEISKMLQPLALRQLETHFCHTGSSVNLWQKSFRLIPTAFASYPSDSIVGLSTSALAFAMLDKQMRHRDEASRVPSCVNEISPALYQARKDYGRALQSLNQVLRTSSPKVIQEALMAIWVLGIYEKVDSKRGPSHTASWATHIKGATAFLRLHEASLDSSPVNVAITQQIFVQTMMYNLLAFEKPGLALKIFLLGADLGSVSSDLVCLMYRTATICAELWEECKVRKSTSRCGSRSRLSRVIRLGKTLDEGLSQWESRLPALLKPQMTENAKHAIPMPEPVEDGHGTATLSVWDLPNAPDSRHVYDRPGAAVAFSIYTALRLQLNFMMLQALRQSIFWDNTEMTPEEFLDASEELLLKDSCTETAVCMTEDLCRTVGTILEDGHADGLKGIFAVYPIRVFMRIMSEDPGLAKQVEIDMPGLVDWGFELFSYAKAKMTLQRLGKDE